MTIAAEVAEKAKSENREPKDVLRDFMVFYDSKAEDILLTIIACMEDKDERGKPTTRGDLLAQMYKEHALCAEKAIECAVKLAPYKHPKLESVELHKTDEKRFVVVIPSKQLSKEDWLTNANTVAKIAAPLPKVGDTISIDPKLLQPVQDIEELGYDPEEVEDCRKFILED